MAETEQLNTSFYPKPGFVEQDPDVILSAAAFVLKSALEQAEITAEELISVRFSCAMHSLICVDEDGHALSQAMIWADGRSSGQAEELLKERGFTFYEKTGTPIHPMSLKEYIVYHWFNKRVVDYSMASASGLFNGALLDWDKEILEHIEVEKEQLSAPVPPTYILSGLHPII